MAHKLSSRTRARCRAVDVLFEARMRDLDDPPGIYGLAQERQAVSTAQTTIPPYAVEILEGVADHLERIDSALETYSRGWPLYRMPQVDLAILRVAVWEILFNPEVDGPVAIKAALEIASERSTDESPKFIHGLLGTINDLREALVAGEKLPEVSPHDARDDAELQIQFDAAAKAAQAAAHGGILEQLDDLDLEDLE